METSLIVIIGFFTGFILSRFVDINFKGFIRPYEVK